MGTPTDFPEDDDWDSSHEHDWSKGLYLCPQHNGTQYKYCRECGVMRLTDESREWMNENNRPEGK